MNDIPRHERRRLQREQQKAAKLAKRRAAAPH
jgi:hypothetical protein